MRGVNNLHMPGTQFTRVSDKDALSVRPVMKRGEPFPDFSRNDRVVNEVRQSNLRTGGESSAPT